MALVRRFDPRRAFRPTVDHSQTIRRIAFRGLLVRISHSAFFVFMVVSVTRSAAGQTLATRFPATTQCSSGEPPCTISVSSRLLSPNERECASLGQLRTREASASTPLAATILPIIRRSSALPPAAVFLIQLRRKTIGFTRFINGSRSAVALLRAVRRLASALRVQHHRLSRFSLTHRRLSAEIVRS